MTDVVIDFGVDLTDLRKSIDSAESDISNALRGIERSVGKITKEIDRSFTKLASSIKQSSSGLNAVGPEAQNAASGMRELDTATDSASRTLSRSATRLDTFSTSISRIGTATTKAANGIQRIASPLAKVSTVALGTQAAIQGLAIAYEKEAFDAAVKFESAQLDLQKVLQDSDGPISQFTDQARTLSQVFGVSATDLLQATANFKQAGFTAEEAAQLTQSALELGISGDIPAVRASELIIRSLKGLDVPVSRTTEIFDLLNAVSNNFATDLNQLATGFAQLSPIADQANLSVGETAGILTPAIEVFGSGSEAARAFRTALLRLGDDSKPVTEALGLLGVQQKNLDGTLKSSGEIYFEVAQAFQFLDESTQLFIAGQLAGKDQAGKFAAAMRGLDTTLQIASDSFKSTGSLAEETSVRLASSKTAIDANAAAYENLNVTIGQQFQQSQTEVIRSLTAVARALETQTRSGVLDGFFNGFNDRLGLLSAQIRTFANVLPQALEQVNFQPFLNSIDAIFGGLLRMNITADGVASVINRIGLGFQALSFFVAGIRDVFVGIGGAIVQVAGAFTSLDPRIQRTIGQLGGAAIILSRFRFAAVGLGAAVAALGSVATVLPRIIAGALGANGATSAIATFAGAAGIGGLIVALTELSGLDEVLAETLNQGSLSVVLGGLGETLKDAFNTALTGAGESLDGFGSQLASVFTNVASTIAPIISNIARLFAETIIAVPEALQQADFSGFQDALGTLFGDLGTLSISVDDVANFITDFGNAVNSVARTIVSAFDLIVGAFGAISSGLGVFNSLDSETRQFAGAIGVATFAIAPLLTAVGGIIFGLSQLLPSFATISTAAGRFASVFRVAAGFAGALSSSLLVVGSSLGLLVGYLTRLTGLDQVLNDILAPDFIFGEGATVGTVIADVVDAIKELLDLLPSLPSLSAVGDFIFGAAEAAEVSTDKIVQQQERIRDEVSKTTQQLTQSTGTVATGQQDVSIKKSQAEAQDVVTQAVNQQAAAEQNVRQQIEQRAAAAQRQALTEVQAGQQVLSIKQQIEFKEKQLQFLEQQAAQQSSTGQVAEARKVLQEKIAARRQELENAQQTLRQITQAEQRANQTIIDNRRSLATLSQRTEDTIADIRRRGLSEQAQQERLIRDAQVAQANAALQALKARTAQTEEAKQAAIAEALSQQERAKTLASQVQDTNKAISLTRDLAASEKLILQEETKIAELTKKTGAEKIAAQKAQIEPLKEELKELQDELTSLQTTETKLDIEANTQQVNSELAALRKQLGDLEKGVTVPIRATQQGFNTGGLVPGFARGGGVSGPGGIDNVPAWLTAGEFVITKAAVQKYGTGFFQSLNAMKLPRTSVSFPSIATPKIASGTQKFATGGPVLQSQSGSTNTLVIRMDNREAEVTGTQTNLDNLTDILALATRGVVT